jgi:ketosteroid isomerase-like protein
MGPTHYSRKALNPKSLRDSNKALVRASFDRWAHGTGSPFELLLPDVEWTIVGSSPLSKTYHGVSSFMAVITFFDAAATAADGVPYRNTYTWYFFMRNGKVTKAIAFFDTREFDDFWQRVKPK